MEKSEQRAILKRLQGIVNLRGDADVTQVISELRSVLEEIQIPVADETRKELEGRNRQYRGGKTRSTR